MKSQMHFLQKLLDDLGSWCCTSTVRDLKTISDRVENEGLSFLTITLPQFAVDLQKGLDEGQVTHDLFVGFSRKGGLPRFLGGFLELIFDAGTGRLIDIPSTDAIFAVRQICMAYGKLKHPCTVKRTRAAFAKYIDCESDIKVHDQHLADSPLLDEFSRLARTMWSSLFTKMDFDVYYDNLRPHHGPGNTAERLTSNSKWRLSDWTRRLDEVFPTMEMLCPSWSLSEDRLSQLNISEPGTEIPVRVVSVPKTLKTPRIIAIEPACMMFVQQGIRDSFEKHLKVDTLRDFVSCLDQFPNQELARLGSIDGSLATLDLSEASDRVSNQLVRVLLGKHPHLNRGVDACRSRKADVPGYGVKRLAKFASMGSALCFPFEGLVFLTLVFLGIEQELNRRLTLSDIKSFEGQVRVYGDDIIVPSRFVHSVYDVLETFGFRVNADKSFWNGNFRESCGKDYYAGHDVSVTRVRTVFPSSRKDVPEILSTISLRNQLYKAGLWRSTRFLDNLLERLIPFPYVEETSSIQGRFSYCHSERVMELDRDLHVPLVRGVVVSSQSPRDSLDDYGALLKCLTYLDLRGVGALPSSDVGHLERSGRPLSVSIKIRMAAPF